MADPVANVEEELVDYEEEEVVAEVDAGAGKGEQVKKGYVGIHSSGFKDFLLKPELIRAIVDCGFEHPSEGEDATQQDTSGGVAHDTVASVQDLCLRTIVLSSQRIAVAVQQSSH